MENGPKIKGRVIISGGGTGGHIYPAIAIADALRAANPHVEILFVGADGKMEMEKVPAAGYNIEGIPVRGLERALTFRNLLFPVRLIRSVLKAGKIAESFRPDVVVGVGGYASGPVGRAALSRGIPLILQEQNSHAGITNRILGRRADKICVAYKGMEKYFPAGKIELTGNPVREGLAGTNGKRREALSRFGFKEVEKVMLVLGGSGGAGIINRTMRKNIGALKDSGIGIIWQSGIRYYKEAQSDLAGSGAENIRLVPFIERMDLAYAAADLVVSRAGAITISELQLTGKPALLIPSPNVAGDHQKMNAMEMVKENAAIMIRDEDAGEEMVPAAVSLIENDEKLSILKERSKAMSKPGAAGRIAEIVMSYLKE